MLEAAIESFAEANYDAGTQASATIFAKVDAIGDCGNDFTVTVTLRELEAEMSNYTLEVDLDKIMSPSGQTFVQTIHRDALCYALDVSITANEAATPAAHQALTTGDGFMNINQQSSGEEKRCFTGTKCNVVFESFDLEDFVEESNWQGDMLASYSGSVFVESSCQLVDGNVTIYYKTDATAESMEQVVQVNVHEVTKILPSNDSNIHTFEATIPVQNVYGYYGAHVELFDATQNSDYTEIWTEEFNLWAPPCYLDVTQFEKEGQTHNLAQSRVAFDLSISLAHHGSRACNSMSALVTIKTGERITFGHLLSAADLEQAIESAFDFTVIVSSADVSSAHITFSDENALYDAVEVIDPVYSAEAPTTCEIEVREFCLISMTPEAAPSTRYSFEFDLSMVASPVCTNLLGTLDIVSSDGTYLGDVTINHDELIDALECDCDKHLIVTADVLNPTGEFYGQLDVREEASGLVEITDSCVFIPDATTTV